MKLISGQDYLNQYPNFKLIGRNEDLERITSILCRKRNNSLLVSGLSGVGLDSLIMGLQLAKNEGNTSFDIMAKQFFWLDIDNLFSNGDSNQINKDFQEVIRILEKTPNSILVIPNARIFMEGAQSSGNNHFINALNNADKSNSFQVIMEVFDNDLSSIYKWNNAIHNLYTLYDVKELNGEPLYECISFCANSLSQYHGIHINKKAIDKAIELTNKYRDDYGLGMAQPKRTISLLDRALSSFKLAVNKEHPILKTLTSDEDKNKFLSEWNDIKNKISNLAQKLQENEAIRIKYSNEIEEEKAKQKDNMESLDNNEIYSFASLTSASGFETKAISDLNKKLKIIDEDIANIKNEYQKYVNILYKNVELGVSEITEEFAKVSGISSAKLDENEIEILKNLEQNLLNRIYGQDEAVHHIANAIKVAKLDKMSDSGPAASYLFLGPSGVGKTEMCKALAQNLFGDERALIRFDMSEYMEKHAVAKLIGAPPGYEGFECGGILTNTVRKNPIGLYLFDEIEKAHPDVFNIFLQILSDGRLTDNIGRTVDFSETIIIMTSNIGQKYYLDASLSNEEAIKLANEELNNTYRSELLNRFNGRENILHFNRLGMDIIQKIIRREISKLNDSYKEKAISISMSDESIKNFCNDHYDVIRGARGLPGYIKANLRPIIVNYLLEHPNVSGTFETSYNIETKTFEVKFNEQG